MVEKFDFLVIGAGVGGASAAYFLRDFGKVGVLEMEGQAGYHTTGRSAALYTELYGNRPIRALVRLSKDFLFSPPDGFTDTPILRTRGTIFAGTSAQRPAIDSLLQMASEEGCFVNELDAADVRNLIPVLREDSIVCGLFEPNSMDIDVHALHTGFLRGIAAGGGKIVLNAEVSHLSRKNDVWRIKTSSGIFEAPIVVNAAGAWGDVIAQRAGIRPIGLTPKRRTVILFDPPPDILISDWPMIIDVAENWYFKPESGRILASPADETPSVACDAQPEEIDVARIAETIERLTIMRVGRIVSSRAGLRTFAKDKTPVVGFAMDAEGFFWSVGQGGYGIETSPAMGMVAANLIGEGKLTKEFSELGALESYLSPDRFAYH